MKEITTLEQLRSHLRDKDEKKVLAAIIANLDPEAADLMCMLVTAYLRFGVRPYTTIAFVQALACNFIAYLEMHRKEDGLHIHYTMNPCIYLSIQNEGPRAYDRMVTADSVVTKQMASEIFEKLSK